MFRVLPVMQRVWKTALQWRFWTQRKKRFFRDWLRKTRASSKTLTKLLRLQYRSLLRPRISIRFEAVHDACMIYNMVLFLFFFFLRLYVRNFWSQEKRLPTATLDRMLTVLQSLYSCQIERCFLSLATNLLLEMTSQSPDFNRNMFEYPLSECTFQVGFISISDIGMEHL